MFTLSYILVSFIHPFSDECTTSQLELFRIPSTVTAIDSERWFHYKPSAALTSSNWIDFRIAGTEEFIDLSSILLEVEIAVTLSDGTALPTAAAAQTSPPNIYDSIAPVNSFFSSLFQQVDLYLNNTLVTSSSNLYHYRSYLDNLLYQSREGKKTYMFSYFWDESEAKRKARIKRIYAGKTIKMIGPLHLDLAQQERLLLNMVDINLRLNTADTAFCLKVTGETASRPKHSFVNATLHVKKKKLFPDCEAGILTALGQETVKYFFSHTQMRHRIIDTGSRTFFFDKVFPGTLPRRFVVGLVPASAFNGDFKEDPYKFTSNGVVEVKAYIDSIQNPVPSIELDTEDEDISRAYLLFFDAMYSLHPSTRLSITPDDFMSHCCFFAWTLSTENDMDDSDTIGLIKRGNCRLDFRFKTPPTKQIACVIYSHFPQVLQIDSNREVLLETV